MESIITQIPLIILSVVFLLGPIVIIHELGHYLAGRMFGAAAESFSVGFGKPIFVHKDKRNTRWRVNWIPFGGFVAFVGETPGEAASADALPAANTPVGKAFMEMSVWQRSVVAVAGPLANFVTAILIFAVIALTFGKPIQKVTVAGFAAGPAEAAGFEIGDIFLSVNDKEIVQQQDILNYVSLSSGSELKFVMERAGQKVDVAVIPERQIVETDLGQKVNIGRIGISMSTRTVEQISFGPFSAVGEGILRTGDIISTTGRVLGRLVTGREPITQLSGPVGIGDLASRVASRTLEREDIPLASRLKALGWNLLQIAAFISVGVGLVNLLPLPVLDGGHLVMNAYEAVTGSVLPERIQGLTLRFGMVFLLTIAAIVTVGDIAKIGFF